MNTKSAGAWRQYLLATSAFAASMTGAQTAAAQDAPTAAQAEPQPDPAATTQAGDELQEIVVTATGRRLAAEKIPYNVTARSEQELREQNITDVKRLIELSPSINAPQNGARFADSVTVRGLNVSPVNANNIEQFARTTVAYYLDDTPLPNIGYRIKDIARVETLLGPQGTLYGANSLGGTIRFITNQPRFDKLEGRISTSIYAAKGGALSHDTDGVLNVPLSNTLAIRASLARLDDGGYTDRVSTPYWRRGAFAWTTFPDRNKNVYKNDDYTKTTTGRIAAAWQATSDIRLTLSHARQNQLAHGTSATSLLPLAIANAGSEADWDRYVEDPNFSPCTTDCEFTDDRETPRYDGYDVIVSRYPEFARRKFNLTAADLDVDLGFADLHSSTSYFRDRRRGQADYAGPGWLFYYVLNGNFGPTEFASDNSAFFRFDNRYSGFNQEVRLTSTTEGPFSWVAGTFFTNSKRNLRFSEFAPGLDDLFGVDRTVSGGRVDEGYRENLGDRYKEFATYGELTYSVTPQWHVTGGGRVFWYKSRAIAQIRDYSFDLVNNNVDESSNWKRRAVFKLNSWYDIAPGALIYGTISQGFRRGGRNGFRDVPPREVSDETQNYKPDRTTNYELGVKGFFADRRIFAQVNVFQIDWKDVQTYFSQSINGFPVNGSANGPDARSRGFEGLFRVRPVDGLTATFSTAYTKAKWNDTRTVCLYTDGTGCRTWSKGGELGGAPRWKHSGDIRYEGRLSPDVTGFASVTGRYVGKVQLDRADDKGVVVGSFPSYALFDVRAGGSWRNFNASLFVENVANKRSPVSEQFDIVLGNRLFYTRPRTAGVNLSYAF